MSRADDHRPEALLAILKDADVTGSSYAVALTVHRFRPAPHDVAAFTRDLTEARITETETTRSDGQTQAT